MDLDLSESLALLLTYKLYWKTTKYITTFIRRSIPSPIWLGSRPGGGVKAVRPFTASKSCSWKSKQPPPLPPTTNTTENHHHDEHKNKKKADVVILIQKVMASVYSSALQQFSGLGRPKPESLRGRQNSKETLWYRRFFWSHLDISIKSSANRQEIYFHQIKSNIHLWHKQKIADLLISFPEKIQEILGFHTAEGTSPAKQPSNLQGNFSGNAECSFCSLVNSTNAMTKWRIRVSQIIRAAISATETFYHKDPLLQGPSLAKCWCGSTGVAAYNSNYIWQSSEFSSLRSTGEGDRAKETLVLW